MSELKKYGIKRKKIREYMNNLWVVNGRFYRKLDIDKLINLICEKPPKAKKVVNITKQEKELGENSFTLTWKDAQKVLPKEGGRYWCIVQEVDDLRVSHYQWNCAYDPEATWVRKWSSNSLSKHVIFWTEFPPDFFNHIKN